MAVEVTKTYKITCDSCGSAASRREDVQLVHIGTGYQAPVEGDLCAQCMDLPLSELIRKLTRGPAAPGTPATDEEQIRAVMAEAQQHPGRLVTR